MAIIESATGKHTAPTAVQIVGSCASRAVHTITVSTAMYTVTGTVSSPRRGQNHASSAMDTTHITTTATIRGFDGQPRDPFAPRGTSGSSAPTKHKCANRNDASPTKKDCPHHGIAKDQSPTADSSRSEERRVG